MGRSQNSRALLGQRSLQQQGFGLGSVFGGVAASSDDGFKVEAQLMENERQIESIGSLRSVLMPSLSCYAWCFGIRSATCALSKDGFGNIR